MEKAPDDYTPSISIGGYLVCNVRFKDNIDIVKGAEEELQDLTGRLEKAAFTYDMKVMANRSKLLADN